ncbi:hypothetical protein J008_04846 [Cryptococcus neoformans]|nr:hypothetical protein J008_04846 [Cryptococcus neoformans var. grubii]
MRVDPTTTDAEMSTYSSVIHISLLYLSIQYQTMNDHLAALNAPPPRYILESDSSDEEGQGAYPGSSTPKPKISIDTPPVEVSVIRGTGNEEVRDLILALGQAGKYLKKHLGVSGSAVGQEEVGKVVVGGRQAGQGWKVGEGLVFSVNEANLPHEAVWEIAQKLLANVKAQSWTIITTYVPAMYIASKTIGYRTRSDPPIRYLSQGEVKVEGAETYETPNYLTGLAGAITSLSAHPSFTIQPTTLILPLPLSALPLSHLSATLARISPSIASALNGKKSKWTEEDDEPYSAPGMGKVRGLARGVGEAVGMYT